MESKGSIHDHSNFVVEAFHDGVGELCSDVGEDVLLVFFELGQLLAACYLKLKLTLRRSFVNLGRAHTLFSIYVQIDKDIDDHHKGTEQPL